MLRDEEGNEERFKIIVEDGVIRERENIELEAETEEVEKLPEMMSESEEIEKEVEVDVVNLEEVSKRVEEMAYRIDELEKKIAKMQEVEITVEKEDEEMPMELSSVSPLNGAPQSMKPITNTRRTASPQVAFLKKLYN
jgi:alanyl-tRNA synthetase